MKVEIERKRWLRGDDQNSYLRRKADRKMCCLGFRCLAVGLSTRAILAQTDPNDVQDKLPEGDWMVDKNGKNSRDTHKAMIINDYVEGDIYKDSPMTEERREQLIAEIFARHGDEAVFV